MRCDDWTSAAALYDGGWRAEDRDELVDVAHLEFLLQSVEILQGRRFVDGSIKHYELVKEG